jgi:hypothetical protein
MFLGVSLLPLLIPTARGSVKYAETDLPKPLHARSLAALGCEHARPHTMPVPSGISGFNFIFA